MLILVLVCFGLWVGVVAGCLADRMTPGSLLRSWRLFELVPVVRWIMPQGQDFRARGHTAFFLALEAAGPLVPIAALAAASEAFLLHTLIGWLLLLASAIDLRVMRLPNIITLPLLACGLWVAWRGEGVAPLDAAVGAGAGYFSLMVIALLYQRLRGRAGLGLGDAKLLAAAGAWTGWQGLPLVVLIGAVSTLVAALMVLQRRGETITGDVAVPFGPGLALGFYMVLLWAVPLAVLSGG